jgi:hypothetical protein
MHNGLMGASDSFALFAVIFIPDRLAHLRMNYRVFLSGLFLFLFFLFCL